MIKQEERAALDIFYKQFYYSLSNDFPGGRINIRRMYKETNPYKTHPYWLYFPTMKIKWGFRNVNLIVKFDEDKLGFEYKVGQKYYSSLKQFFSRIESVKKYSKAIKSYECLFEETEKSLFIYINIPHIDIHKDLGEQSNELVFLVNAIFDFCLFHRYNSYEIIDILAND